jgi:hypothetical protein
MSRNLSRRQVVRGDVASVNATARGPDWGNAAARYALALSVPVVATVLFELLGGTPGGNAGAAVVVLWGIGLVIGWLSAWQAWHGMVTGSTLRATTMEISGRTGWPLRRWRSVRLDALTRVHYYKLSERGGIGHYIAARDQAGGRVMVHLHVPLAFLGDPPPDLQLVRYVLLRALNDRPAARAGWATRRQLERKHPQGMVPLAFLRLMAMLYISLVLAYLISLQLGAIT